MNAQEELLAIEKRKEAAKAVGTVVALIIFSPLIFIAGVIVYAAVTA